MDLNKYVIRVQGGREYLPVAPRVVAFRAEHPDWAIVTELIPESGEPALVKAYIQNGDGNVIATAHKTVVSFKGGDVEKAETGAIGRALSLCGFGTLQALDLDEGEQLADAPIGADPVVEDEPDSLGIAELCQRIIADGDHVGLVKLKSRIEKITQPNHKNAARRHAALAQVLIDVSPLSPAKCREAAALISGLPDDTPGKSKALQILQGMTDD